jgi:hypothetical protein
MARSMGRIRLVGLAAVALVLAACGGVGGTSDAGQTGGASGGSGGSGGTTGAGGTTGSGGQGGACGPCAASITDVCPSDVATASMCPSSGRTCCLGEAQWTCGACAAETCHWMRACPATTGTAGTGGGGGRGGTGGAGGGSGGSGGAGGGGGSAVGGCAACNYAAQYCSVTVGGGVGLPPSYQCQPLPAACATNPTCACLSGKACTNQCTETDGGVTATCYAP